MGETTRLHLPYPELPDIADVPQDMKELAQALDTVVPYSQGPQANRPVSTSGTPGIAGRLYLNTDTAPNPRLDLDLGTSWITVGYIADGSIGTTQLADHSVTRVKLALPAVGDTELFDGAVTTAKLADFGVTAGKLAAALKPSQGAGAGTEALRALGIGPGLALNISDLQFTNAAGTLASRPAANTVGQGSTYYATDQDATYRSTGTNWIRTGPQAGDIFFTLNAVATPGRVLLQGQAWPAIDGIYADLYSKWGGSNLPDLRGRVPVIVSPGGKAEVDNIRDNDGRAANLRNISHRHQQDPQTSYMDVFAPTYASDASGNTRTGFTSGDPDNKDYPAYFVLQAEGKL